MGKVLARRAARILQGRPGTALTISVSTATGPDSASCVLDWHLSP